MFANCYKGRRVFITGHTGFKGSWLAAWLSQMGSTVCGFADCVPTSPSHFEAMHLEQHVQDMRGDIRDRDAVVRAMKEFRPDVVFHLAAQALVRKSYEDAPLTFEANMLGTLNMLEAVRQCPSVEAAVFITSDKCYRNDEWVWGYRPSGRRRPLLRFQGLRRDHRPFLFQELFQGRPGLRHRACRQRHRRR